MNDIYISVIMPAYNSEKFIESSILSVVKQPVKVELVIVNDGSVDGTDEICRKLAQVYKNINYIKVDNGGAGRARNIGLKMAKGKFIMYIDSDDLYYPNAINDKFIEKLQKYDQEGVDAILTCKSLTNMEGTIEPIVTKPECIDRIKNHIPFNAFWTFIIRKSFMEQKDISFFEYREQDIETAFRYKVFSRTDKLVSDPDISFYLQRDNLESNTHTFNYCNLYSIKMLVYDRLDQEFESYRLRDDDHTQYYLKREVVRWAYKYFRYIRKEGINDWSQEQMKQVINALENIKIVTPWEFKDTEIKQMLKYYWKFFAIRIFALTYKKSV